MIEHTVTLTPLYSDHHRRIIALLFLAAGAIIGTLYWRIRKLKEQLIGGKHN